MKKLMLFLFIFLASVWVGLLIKNDPGYALFAYRAWTVEMPLWFALILIVLTFVVFYLLVRLFNTTGTLRQRWRLFMARRRLRRSYNITTHGLIALFEGNFRIAEKDLVQASSNSATPLVNYVAAAFAAQQQGDYDKRDNYLRLADTTLPEATTAIRLVQAQLELNAQQLDEAQRTLQGIIASEPHHVHALRLLKDLYLKQHQWEKLTDLLPTLRRTKAISVVEYSGLQLQSYSELLKHAIQKPAMPITVYWQHLPRQVRKMPEMVRIYVPALLELNEHEQAELVLSETLKNQWDERLVLLYGQVSTDQTAKQLSTAQHWLKSHPNDPALLLTLGKLCARNQLWGLARSYLEHCASLAPKSEVYYELAQLSEKLGDLPTANRYYRLCTTHPSLSYPS